MMNWNLYRNKRLLMLVNLLLMVWQLRVWVLLHERQLKVLQP